MAFGENLVKLRKQNKLTQEQVAEKLEITRQTISNWELNQTKPDLEQLIGLSKLYNVSLDELAEIHREDTPSKTRRQSKNIDSNLSKYRAYLVEYKKVWIMILALLCIIAIGICGRVDYVLNGSITWSSVPALSITFGYVAVLPLFMKKHKMFSFF